MSGDAFAGEACANEGTKGQEQRVSESSHLRRRDVRSAKGKRARGRGKERSLARGEKGGEEEGGLPFGRGLRSA